VYGEFLYLKARGTDTPFGQPRDGFSVLSVPRGSQGIVEPGYAPGVKAGLSYALGPNSSIGAHFSWWESRDQESVTAPPGTVIQSALTFPGIMNAAADSMAAAASLRLALRTAEVEYNHLLSCDRDSWAIAWLAGIRYAHLEQNLTSSFSILGTTTVDSHINFDGVGPRLGVEAELPLKGGLSLFGRSTVDVLAGRFAANLNQFNVFAGNQGNTDYRNTRLVPVVDLLLGAGWSSSKGHLHFRIGYDLSAWFNTLTTPDFIKGAQTNNFTTNGNNLRDTLTFDGLVARLEINF
jgi:hypothetical protein